MIYITGNEPFKTPLSSKSILFKVFHKNENRFSSNIDYNLEKDRWEGEFRASKPGEYLFKIFIDELGDPIQLGKFNVLESQIELSQVYLNQKLLTEISEKTKGEYYHWDDKDKLINSIEPNFRRSLKADVIKLTQSRFVLFVIILILFVEWFTRRKNGLI